jgi:hypothetical protein
MEVKKKKRKKELQKKQLLSYVKDLKVSWSQRQLVNLNEDKLLTHLCTVNACWRPDIYLDNGRNCNGCSLFENCSCKIKRLKK